MPMYEYECCGKSREEFRFIAVRDESPACDACGKPMTRVISSVRTEMEYTESMGESRSYRFNPKTVAKARRIFKAGTITDDGRVLFKNRTDAIKFSNEYHSKIDTGSG